MAVDITSLLEKVQKPARYTGGELNSVVKSKADVNIRFAFCFPDLYEIGMSHLGIKLLYGLLNSLDGVWCERVFEPDDDMAALMKENGIPLYGLESRDPLTDFDFIGFTLQYEMCYTSVLHMLEMGGIPLLAAERGEDFPIVVGGGPCVCNPEPIADFFDIFLPGEGEEVLPELMQLYREHRQSGWDKRAFLRAASHVEGVYVPSLYSVDYHEDGTVAAVTPTEGAPATIRKRIVRELDTAYYPDSFPVPFIDVVHDRAVTEVFRGCIRGCRFCQAGFIYRPVREKSPETVNRQSRVLCEATGYEEFSLLSLSTGDYTQLEPLLDDLLSWAEPQHTNIGLPSLRLDSFSPELANRLNILRRNGLTFAPEAGTQRLRDAINKNLTEEEILSACRKAFAAGWTGVKLYFMLGLPTETDDDVRGIAELGQKIVDLYYRNPDKPKGKAVSVSISPACFVPKPFTPFQWEPQATLDELEHRQQLLRESLTTRKITISRHDARSGHMEAVLARGDRRLSAALLEAHRRGFRLEAWGEHFSYEAWQDVFRTVGLDPAFYANRRREYTEVFPWDHLDYGVTKSFLEKENRLAHNSVTTPNCREKCSGCGAACWKGGLCVEDRTDRV